MEAIILCSDQPKRFLELLLDVTRMMHSSKQERDVCRDGGGTAWISRQPGVVFGTTCWDQIGLGWLSWPGLGRLGWSISDQVMDQVAD